MSNLVSTIIDADDLIYMADIKEYCSFKLSARLEYLVLPKNQQSFMKYLFQLDNCGIGYKILGNMTNVVPVQNIIRGVYISTRFIDEPCQIFGTRVIVNAGTSLAKLCNICKDNSLSGLEGLFGIPASVGGAIFNNAGAYGSSISDHLESVLVYDHSKVVNIDAKELHFDYRKSDFQGNGQIILSATFNLAHENIGAISEKMQTILKTRCASQPKGASAGSIFKKCDGVSAGYYIDNAGLKGTKCGGAIISEKHANFIINENNASFNDVCTLIKIVQDKVKEKYNILLEREVEFLGERNESFSRLSYT